MGALTLISLISIICEMFIYRKTFISVFIPIFILIAGGFCAYLLVRKKSWFYNGKSDFSFARSFHGTFTFGGILMFIFMALNYYIKIDDCESISLKVVKTDHFGSKHGVGDPYVIVRYENMRKQLVFPRDVHVENCVSVRMQINKGLFGFKTIEWMELENFKSDRTSQDVRKQYDKIKQKAEEQYSKGDTRKAIKLYERAVQLKPTDKAAVLRLEELKRLN